jgi:hypothetical protein
MRKTFVAIVAAGAMGAVWADATAVGEQYQDQTRFQDQPRASAYLSYGFGGNTHRSNAPASLHYGLRLDHDSRVHTSSGVALPPLFQLDHDNVGETLASANGIPFAGRNLRLNQNGDNTGGSSGGGSDSGWSFFDWGLLAVGVAGTGFLVAEATKGKNSPNAAPSSAASSSGGASSSSSGVCVLSTCLPTLAPTDYSDYYGAEQTPEHERWLNQDHGHMGDLQAAP